MYLSAKHDRAGMQGESRRRSQDSQRRNEVFRPRATTLTLRMLAGGILVKSAQSIFVDSFRGTPERCTFRGRAEGTTADQPRDNHVDPADPLVRKLS